MGSKSMQSMGSGINGIPQYLTPLIELPISKFGGFITLGQQQGTLYDFAGTSSFVSAGVGPLVLDGTLSDSGKYGINFNLGGGYALAGGRSSTTVLSLGKGIIESGCDAFAC